MSDRRRDPKRLEAAGTKAIFMWVKDRSLPDDFILPGALERLKIIEAEGLEASACYENNLMDVLLCYIALGDFRKAKKHAEVGSKIVQRMIQRKQGIEFQVVFEKMLRELEDVQTHELWNIRRKERRRR